VSPTDVDTSEVVSSHQQTNDLDLVKSLMADLTGIYQLPRSQRKNQLHYRLLKLRKRLNLMRKASNCVRGLVP